MRAEFNLNREQSNSLYVSDVKNPNVHFHFHSQIELYLVTKGEVEIWINEQRRILRAGEMSVAFSYDAHRYRSVSEAEAHCMIFPTDLCGEFLSLLSRKQVRTPFISDRALFDEIDACYHALKKSENEIKTRGYIYVILGTLLEHMSLENRAEPVDPQFSARLLLYVSENFRRDISLSSIAAAMGYHPSYLSRAFRSHFRIGLNRYISLLRLREAVLLLKEHKKSVTDAAYESGFRSLRTFYRVFYDEFGCTPKEYLKQAEDV